MLQTAFERLELPDFAPQFFRLCGQKGFVDIQALPAPEKDHDLVEREPSHPTERDKRQPPKHIAIERTP
ncbi:hypothetical protein BH10PSE8_BH10PSE8_04180 [soil metagenome]